MVGHPDKERFDDDSVEFRSQAALTVEIDQAVAKLSFAMCRTASTTCDHARLRSLERSL